MPGSHRTRPYVQYIYDTYTIEDQSQSNVQYIYDTYTIEDQNVIPQNISSKPNTYPMKITWPKFNYTK